MPRNWTFSVNSTIGQVKRNVTLPTVLLTANGTYDHSSMPVLVNRTVEIGGDIYWDLDDDNRSDAGEASQTSSSPLRASMGPSRRM